MATEVYVGRIRSVVSHSVLSLATLGIYFLIWYGKLVHDLRTHRGRGQHPAVAILLTLLVPLLGGFISFLIAGRTVRRLQKDVDADKATSGFVAALWGLIPIIGWTIGAGILQSGANRAWDRLHQDLGHATLTPVTLECPQCSGRFDQFLHPFAPNPVACPHCGRAAASL